MKWNPFLYREELIEQYINNNISFEYIVKKLSESCIDEKDILIQLKKDKEWIQEREKNWDIKISDFIWNRFRVVQLFYDIGHPTNILLKEIANRILTYLGIEHIISGEIDRNLGCMRFQYIIVSEIP